MTTANAVKSNFNNFFTEGSIEYIYEDDQVRTSINLLLNYSIKFMSRFLEHLSPS